MTTAEILTAARDLIADPSRWTQNEFGRTSDGNGTSLADEAVQFCALGAIAKVCNFEELDHADDDTMAEVQLLNECATDLFGDTGIVMVNDQRGHADVLQAFACAIKKANLPVKGVVSPDAPF